MNVKRFESEVPATTRTAETDKKDEPEKEGRKLVTKENSIQ